MTTNEEMIHCHQAASHRSHIMNVWGYLPQWFGSIPKSQIEEHDLSKYTLTEIEGYTDKWIFKKDSEEWKRALVCHYANNKHHPQHWRGEDMPMVFLLESIVDMFACRWERNFKSEDVTVEQLANIPSGYLTRYNDHDREIVIDILEAMKTDKTELHFVKELRYKKTKDCLDDVLENPAAFPNLRDIAKIPVTSIVHVPRRSKIKPSVVANSLTGEIFGDKPIKKMPIMSLRDPRSQGEDPILKAVRETLRVECPPIPEREIRTVRQDMYEFYFNRLNPQMREHPLPDSIWRELTIEEAIAGVPGLLEGINVSTSPGLPLVLLRTSKGKTSFVDNIDGDLRPTQLLRDMLTSYLKDMKEEEPNHTWLGYLKDELISESKERDARMRIIYCGDLVSNVAFRMKFGSLHISLNRAYRDTPMCIGLNQYSRDMTIIKEYLDQVDGPGYIAGDAKNFDRTTHRQVQEACYEILMEIAMTIPGVMRQECKFFIKHQVDSPAQVLEYEFLTVANHMSGCFFTTPMNCLVHEAYWRIVFSRLCPTYLFEREVRCRFLGDDNIIKPSHKVFGAFNAVTYSKEAAKFGQTYTSDDKTTPLTSEPRPFKITFLGAHPLPYEEIFWTGALKKSTLTETMRWTRDDDETIEQTAEQMIYLCSQWDEGYFQAYRGHLERVLAANRVFLDLPGYETMRRIQFHRSAEGGADYGNLWMANTGMSKGGKRDLVDMYTPTGEVIGEEVTVKGPFDKSLCQQPLDADYALRGKVLIKQFDWAETDVQGANLFKTRVPWDAMALNTASTIHKHIFEMYCMWTGDVEITIQTNGNPFQQGLLICYFVPLTKDHDNYQTGLTLNHIRMTPKSSVDGVLRIPFRHPRAVLRSKRATEREQLGEFRIDVLSPLVGVKQKAVSVSVYIAFPNSRLFLPQNKEGWVANGAAFSRGGDSFYSVGNVVGDLMIEGNSSAKSEGDLSIPMDNPSLCSGSIPTHQAYSGMSKVNGIEPTVSLQMHPIACSHPSASTFGIREKDFLIEEWCKKNNMVASFEWSTGNTEGFAFTN